MNTAIQIFMCIWCGDDDNGCRMVTCSKTITNNRRQNDRKCARPPMHMADITYYVHLEFLFYVLFIAHTHTRNAFNANSNVIKVYAIHHPPSMWKEPFHCKRSHKCNYHLTVRGKFHKNLLPNTIIIIIIIYNDMIMSSILHIPDVLQILFKTFIFFGKHLPKGIINRLRFSYTLCQFQWGHIAYYTTSMSWTPKKWKKHYLIM